MREKEEINKDLLQMVEKLSEEKPEKDEEHVAEVKEVIVEVKASVVVVIWEAKVTLAEGVANVGS